MGPQVCVAKEAMLFLSYIGGHCQTRSITPSVMRMAPSSTSPSRSVRGLLSPEPPEAVVRVALGSLHLLGRELLPGQGRARQPLLSCGGWRMWLLLPERCSKSILEIRGQEPSKRRGPDWRVSVTTPLKMTESSC